METLLKSKGLWQYTKIAIPDPTNDQAKFVIDGKKDEAIRVITTYISWEIRFHTNEIDCAHAIWKKLKSLFDTVDKSQVIQIEKELISLDPHFFNKIEDYLAHVKEL